jgi:hypothetical protein
MWKHLILLFAVFVSCQLPAAGQSSPSQIFLAQRSPPPISAAFSPPPAPLLAALPASHFRFSQALWKFPVRFPLSVAGAYSPDPIFQRLSPMNEVRTLTLTQASIPLIQLWGGRLQLDAFQSTLHGQIVQIGLFGYGGIKGFGFSRQIYPGEPLSVHLSGLSLSFHLGRNARGAPPIHAWRHMTRIVSSVLG